METALERLHRRYKDIHILEIRREADLDKKAIRKVYNQMKSRWNVPRLQNRNPGDPKILHQFNINTLKDEFIVWKDRGEHL